MFRSRRTPCADGMRELRNRNRGATAGLKVGVSCDRMDVLGAWEQARSMLIGNQYLYPQTEVLEKCNCSSFVPHDMSTFVPPLFSTCTSRTEVGIKHQDLESSQADDFLAFPLSSHLALIILIILILVMMQTTSSSPPPISTQARFPRLTPPKPHSRATPSKAPPPKTSPHQYPHSSPSSCAS